MQDRLKARTGGAKGGTKNAVPTHPRTLSHHSIASPTRSPRSKQLRPSQQKTERLNIALINPAWSFNRSIYFGCPEPHLPLEVGYSRALLEQKGHAILLMDAQQEQLSNETIFQRLQTFRPNFIVVITAPRYIFWRGAPPELRFSMEALRPYGCPIIGVGPHASSTPKATLHKLNADVVVMGEFEEILVELVETPPEEWKRILSICYREQGEIVLQGLPHVSDLSRLPPLSWPDEIIQRHVHHHRFDRKPAGPGAEMEIARGRSFHCTLCAKEHVRDDYRTRPLSVILDELDRLIRQGVEYVYFIDKHFQPNRELLEVLATRPIVFGVQLRIDQWDRDMLDLLGQAGCVSIKARIEHCSGAGRDLLKWNCRLSMEELTDRLIEAKQAVPFVQATFLDARTDDVTQMENWRQKLLRYGVWSDEPVPLNPYPGPPEFIKRWETPDDPAWKRGHDSEVNRHYWSSDVQADYPLPLPSLETPLP